MPIAFCHQCQRRFVIENERSFQRTCPRCLRAMDLATPPDWREEHPPEGSARAAASADDFEGIWLNEAPLAADELGRRVLSAVAEAAYQRNLAQAQRELARTLRRESRLRVTPPARADDPSSSGGEAAGWHDPEGANRPDGAGPGSELPGTSDAPGPPLP